MPTCRFPSIAVAGSTRPCAWPSLATDTADYRRLIAIHDRFHALANDIIDLSNNGLADSADLLLPELSEASHKLVNELDKLRIYREALAGDCCPLPGPR